MAGHYEIEVKSLLGDKANADALLGRLSEQYPDMRHEKYEAQLNHYFLVDTANFEQMGEVFEQYFSEEERQKFISITKEGKNISLRTRKANDTVLLVMKASLDDNSSANGIMRLEFEVELPLSLDELDQILLDAGCTYQSKWSRTRNVYTAHDMNICIDNNAGYGYLAEFERMAESPDDAESVRAELRSVMDTLGVVELAQDRIERMFTHYNQNWNEYYGTDNIFVID